MVMPLAEYSANTQQNNRNDTAQQAMTTVNGLVAC